MYEARGRQDGITVFQVAGEDAEFVMNEVNRYAALYLLEGPLVIEQKFGIGKRWKKLIEFQAIFGRPAQSGH